MHGAHTKSRRAIIIVIMYSLGDFGFLLALIVVAAFAISFLVGYVTFDRKRTHVHFATGTCWADADTLKASTDAVEDDMGVMSASGPDGPDGSEGPLGPAESRQVATCRARDAFENARHLSMVVTWYAVVGALLALAATGTIGALIQNISGKAAAKQPRPVTATSSASSASSFTSK